MIKDTLLQFVEKVDLESGALLSFYDFSGCVDSSNKDSFFKLTSGASTSLDTYLIYNQLHDTGSQLSGAVSPLINVNKYPAVVSSSSSSVTGSGFFEGETTVRNTKPINSQIWSCFLEFSGNGFSSQNPTKNQVLLSTMKDANSLSGFNVGINASNRLYVEYISGQEGSNQHRVVETLDKHLRGANLVSVAKNSGVMELSLHNPNYDTSSLWAEVDKQTHSESFYVGGFSKGNSYSNFYTGFHGHINNFVLFDDFVSLSDRDTLSRAYYTEEIKEPRTVTGALLTNEVTGVEVQSLLSGTGVVSYEQVQSGTMNTEAGNVPVYVNSGVTGGIYQSYLVDLTGSNTVTNITGYYSGESEVSKASHISYLNKIPGKLTFTQKVENDDVVEVYNHDSFLDTLAFDGGRDVANLGVTTGDRTVRGYFLKNKSFSFDSAIRPYVQLYRNGLVLQGVAGLFDTHDLFNNHFNTVGENGRFTGDYFIDDPRKEKVQDISYAVVLNDEADTFSSKDQIMYDIVLGETETGLYSGASAHFTGKHYNGGTKDIYLNGLKLLSGKDYIKSEVSHDDVVYLSYLLDSNYIGSDITGSLLFVPQASPKWTRTTGVGLESVSVSNVFFEQVWRNGARQIPGVDYFRFANDSIITGVDTPSAVIDSFELVNSRRDLDVSVVPNVDNSKDALFVLSKDSRENFLK
ncbi:MAG TPA: hypothetical protein EYG21_09535 [Nitrospinaceae bacterium]|nr:hypothetical protein [Nitrospinaceae bacterium]